MLVLQSFAPARSNDRRYCVRLVDASGLSHRVNFGNKNPPSPHTPDEVRSRRNAFILSNPVHAADPLRPLFWTARVIWGDGTPAENLAQVCADNDIQVFGPVTF